MLIGRVPRVRLATLPTPLEPAPRFSEMLGGPKVWLKRDDLTGLGMGGNKARKLEFLMAEALASGADVVVTAGGKQSNHCRMTAAAARKLGLDPVLVLTGDPDRNIPGNLLLDIIYGAEIHYAGDVAWPELEEMECRVCEDLRRKGRRPYLIPVGGATPTGSVGYVNGIVELSSQMYEMGLAADYLYHPTGSCGTQAGLVLGSKALSAGFKVVGVSVSRDQEQVCNRVAELCQKTAELLGIGCKVEGDDIVVLDGYVGERYGVPSPASLEAIKILAETEGVLLDPVYTGKAMAGLIDQIRKGKFKKTDNVIFLHTGGAPALFAFEEYFRS